MNAAANTDPNAPADSPTSKRTRRKPDPEPDVGPKKKPPARRPKLGQPDPEEGKVQRRNAPDPDIDGPISEVVHKLISASGQTRKDVATKAALSEFTANDLVWTRRTWTLPNFAAMCRALGYKMSEVLVLAGIEEPQQSIEDAIRSDRTLDAVTRQAALAYIKALRQQGK